MAAYKRLLPCALEAVAGGATGEQLAPHLNKVYSTWPEQQKRAMNLVSQIGSRSKIWVSGRKRTFTRLRDRLGETELDGIFRVTWTGEIVFDREEAQVREISLKKQEIESCILMYSFYTLVLGAPYEVKSRLAELLASKLI